LNELIKFLISKSKLSFAVLYPFIPILNIKQDSMPIHLKFYISAIFLDNAYFPILGPPDMPANQTTAHASLILQVLHAFVQVRQYQ